MRHLQITVLVLSPSTLDNGTVDAPNGVVHLQVTPQYRAEDGTAYLDPAGAQDVEVKDAAIGQLARDLMAACAAKLADASALPVRDKADATAPLVQPRAR